MSITQHNAACNVVPMCVALSKSGPPKITSKTALKCAKFLSNNSLPSQKFLSGESACPYRPYHLSQNIRSFVYPVNASVLLDMTKTVQEIEAQSADDTDGFLKSVSQRDRKIIELGDEKFTPLTWDNLKDIIGMLCSVGRFRCFCVLTNETLFRQERAQ